MPAALARKSCWKKGSILPLHWAPVTSAVDTVHTDKAGGVRSKLLEEGIEGALLL